MFPCTVLIAPIMYTKLKLHFFLIFLCFLLYVLNDRTHDTYFHTHFFFYEISFCQWWLAFLLLFVTFAASTLFYPMSFCVAPIFLSFNRFYYFVNIIWFITPWSFFFETHFGTFLRLLSCTMSYNKMVTQYYE